MPAIVPGQLVLSTPLGVSLRIANDGEEISAADFVPPARTTRPRSPLEREAAAQVRAYFARRLDRFDLPLRFEGTAFECGVWQLVASLHVGELISYGDVGRALGHPRSHRGVAAAMRKTPIDLFVPAHRVVGADARVKGDGNGSLRRRLLVFEGFTVGADGAIRT
jgi:methylated-DNA-[protein]-cysteine S-methyltransferase